ncbi:hypothetical protein [Marinicrinis sediminis]
MRRRKKAGKGWLLLGLFLLALVIVVFWYVRDQSGDRELVWRIGMQDGSAAEFGKEVKATDIRTVNVDQLLKLEDDLAWATIPSGLSRSINADLEVSFALNEPSPHGYRFRIGIVQAPSSIPQLAVFMNGQFAGMLQIAGTADVSGADRFANEYELDLSTDLIRDGNNTLRLEIVRCLYCSDAEDDALWIEWDMMELLSWRVQMKESVHSRTVRMGTMINDQQFFFNEQAVKVLPAVTEWLGIAYSRNVLRAGCPSNVAGSCSHMEAYYRTMAELNLEAVAMHLYTGDLLLNEGDGTLSDTAAGQLRQYLEQYGNYVHYYEVDNEPGLFNRSKQVNLAIANWMDDHARKLAPHLEVVSPGWAYWPTYAEKPCREGANNDPPRCGEPDGWAGDAGHRKDIEERTDWTNGHAYGRSYMDAKGGSLIENMRSVGRDLSGLRKPMMVTEFGTSDTHTDPEVYGATQPHAAAFDRIVRAHIGFADVFIQHAAFYDAFALFEQQDSHIPDVSELRMHHTVEMEEPRAAIFRRYALAYATHGKPLLVERMNKEETRDRKMYVRAVDTSELAPLPGSGGSSRKLLIQGVNFEESPQRMQVRVHLPDPGLYIGKKVGADHRYEEAMEDVVIDAGQGTAEFVMELGGGAAVQWILEKSSLQR